MTDTLPGVEPVPLTPPAQRIEGDSHQHLIAPLQDLGRELGYRVETRVVPDDGPGGWCRRSASCPVQNSSRGRLSAPSANADLARFAHQNARGSAESWHVWARSRIA